MGVAGDRVGQLDVWKSRKMNAKYFFLALVVVGLARGQDEELCPEGAQDWPHHECHLFYLCDNFGVPVEQECPEGLYWDPVIHACNFPENVPECVDGTRPPTGTTTPVPSSTTTTPPPTTTTVTTSTTTTTAATTTTTTQPTTVTSSTPTPTQTTQSPTTTITTTTTTAASTTTTTEPTPETEVPLTTTRLPPGVCPETGIHKIAHPDLCAAYYLCINGERQEPHSMCPEGLYFDPSIEECNLASDVDCPHDPTTPTSGPTTTGPTTEAPFPECPPEGLAYLPYPSNCTLYILCLEGTGVIYRCPDGTLFDSVKLACEPEATAVCSSLSFKSLFNVRSGRRVELALFSVGNVEVKVEEESGGASSFFKKFFNGWGF